MCESKHKSGDAFGVCGGRRMITIESHCNLFVPGTPFSPLCCAQAARITSNLGVPL